MADIDATFVQKILDIPERKREPDVQHNSQTDNLGARLEVAKRRAFGHGQTLENRPARLKLVLSDKAQPTGRCL